MSEQEQCTIPVGHYFACQNHTDQRIRYVPTDGACSCHSACSADESCQFTTSQNISNLCQQAGFPYYQHNGSYYSCNASTPHT